MDDGAIVIRGRCFEGVRRQGVLVLDIELAFCTLGIVSCRFELGTICDRAGRSTRCSENYRSRVCGTRTFFDIRRTTCFDQDGRWTRFVETG